jgi:hypothetical protein
MSKIWTVPDSLRVDFVRVFPQTHSVDSPAMTEADVFQLRLQLFRIVVAVLTIVTALH